MLFIMSRSTLSLLLSESLPLPEQDDSIWSRVARRHGLRCFFNFDAIPIFTNPRWQYLCFNAQLISNSDADTGTKQPSFLVPCLAITVSKLYQLLSALWDSCSKRSDGISSAVHHRIFPEASFRAVFPFPTS
jgi:hypothetical protein